MYTHCIHCNATLGRNETIEAFPVGRRLAFDGATGRLWVVCRRCARWNLTPLEERWEAIEECERAFRATRLRSSTGEIGLARVRDGFDLVRIGAPEQQEFAAWRYGDQFGRRRRRALLTTAAMVGAYASVEALGLGTLTGVVSLIGLPVIPLYLGATVWAYRRSVARIAVDGRVLGVTSTQLSQASLTPRAHGQWSLILPHKGEPHAERSAGMTNWITSSRVLLEGDAALGALRKLMPLINTMPRPGDVSDAVELMQRSGDPVRVLANAARHTLKLGVVPGVNETMLNDLPQSARLAVEMAVHEDEERRAMNGELDALHAAWREADAIAAIADQLTLPPEVEEELRRLRERR